VTISITIRWVINSLANGLGVGGMAVVARRIGEQHRAAAEHAAWQTILLGLITTVVMSGLGLLGARPLLSLLGADETVLPLGLSYLHVAFGGMVTLVLVFVINSMLRGAGEARLAMAVLFLSTAVNVVLEPVLIFGLGPFPALGVAGSAWAFVLGFGAGMALQIVILLRGRARIGINLHDLRPDPVLMKRIVRIATPSAVQMILRASSRLIIIGLVGMYGTFATAGYGVANRLLLIAIIPIFGLGNATGTLVGQNLGAHKPERAAQSAWWVSGYSAGYMALAGTALFVFARPLISLFDSTPAVVSFGVEALIVLALAFLGILISVLALWLV
jgi:putative MATE family efflux protein